VRSVTVAGFSSRQPSSQDAPGTRERALGPHLLVGGELKPRAHWANNGQMGFKEQARPKSGADVTVFGLQTREDGHSAQFSASVTDLTDAG
jgi:hypothetical protein